MFFKNTCYIATFSSVKTSQRTETVKFSVFSVQCILSVSLWLRSNVCKLFTVPPQVIYGSTFLVSPQILYKHVILEADVLGLFHPTVNLLCSALLLQSCSHMGASFLPVTRKRMLSLVLHTNNNNNFGVLGYIVHLYYLLSEIFQVEIIQLLFVLDVTKLPLWMLFVF